MGDESTGAPLALDQVSELFQEVLEAVARPKSEAGDGRNLAERMRAHLGFAPGDQPVVKTAYAPYDLPNVHLAVERWFAAEGRSYELIGMRGFSHHEDLTLGDILESADRYNRFVIGAVDYAQLPVSPDEELACVSFGFYLGQEGEGGGGGGGGLASAWGMACGSAPASAAPSAFAAQAPGAAPGLIRPVVGAARPRGRVQQGHFGRRQFQIRGRVPYRLRAARSGDRNDHL